MRDGKILAHEVKNQSDGRTWFVPPGGGVDFGESSQDALEREMKEELGWEIEFMTFVGAFESFHIINGIQEHEISFVYNVRPSQNSNPEPPVSEIEEADGMKRFRWMELDSLRLPGMFLYPEGLLEKIEAITTSPSVPEG